MTPTRVAIAIPGILLGLFGVFRLLTEVPNDDLVQLAIWLVVAVILHDGVLSPLVVGAGWVIARLVPPRARGFVQGGLIAGVLISAIALPMIYRGDVQPASKAILRQDYGVNLLIALAIVAAVTVVAYAVTVLRTPRVSRAKPRPDDDQDSSTT